MLNEHLENLIKAEIEDKTVLNTKRIELTSKLRMDMVSPPWKLLFEAHSHQFLTQNSKEGSWQHRGTPGEGNKLEK
jgi:hypothetical protein